ncbi:hypothetical protein L3X38_043396 [Prunus dulcis]|uniref:Transposase MuDR plant domain-containing protein n=1 Tax=Prunus dulcis TaxID=3755 RepID=A0AAD4UWD7_PRUDU|nr:hypothetical protein L3X38_043396 [Prunus dulcis]
MYLLQPEHPSSPASICSSMGITSIDNPGIYLGLPSIWGRSKKSALGFIRERIKKRLEGWESSSLSLGSYECQVVKNDKFRLSVKCKEDCKWRLYASLMQGENTYQIKSYTPKHSCSKGFHNKNITSTFLSQRYMSRIKDDPKIKKTTL